MPVAVFILVIMALLAAAIVQLSSPNNISAAQEILSTRAFYAAESGASWAMSQLFLMRVVVLLKRSLMPAVPARLMVRR